MNQKILMFVLFCLTQNFMDASDENAEVYIENIEVGIINLPLFYAVIFRRDLSTEVQLRFQGDNNQYIYEHVKTCGKVLADRYYYIEPFNVYRSVVGNDIDNLEARYHLHYSIRNGGVSYPISREEYYEAKKLAKEYLALNRAYQPGACIIN